MWNLSCELLSVARGTALQISSRHICLVCTGRWLAGKRLITHFLSPLVRFQTALHFMRKCILNVTAQGEGVGGGFGKVLCPSLSFHSATCLQGSCVWYKSLQRMYCVQSCIISCTWNSYLFGFIQKRRLCVIKGVVSHHTTHTDFNPGHTKGCPRSKSWLN